jgi:hypothetical protein
MTGTIPALPAEVAATIEGDVSGQVIVGDHNLQLQIGAIHGGMINLAPPGRASQHHRRRWTEVLRLGRAIDPALTLARRWAAWERALRWVETAARALSDGGAEGWALHQLGTRALCLDEKDRARPLLRRALDLRRSLHDVAGAAVTGHNLWFLDGLPPIDGPDGDDSDGGGDQSGGDAGGDGSGGAGHSNGGASWHLPRWLQQLATVGAGLAVLGVVNLIAKLERAVFADQPALDQIAAAPGWFERDTPKLASLVRDRVVHPAMDALGRTGGETTAPASEEPR